MIDFEFKVESILGRGGSSTVFLVSDSANDQYAIKTVNSGFRGSKTMSAAMLEQEHYMLNQVEEHPNIINSLCVNTSGEIISEDESVHQIHYIVLEYAAKGALSTFIRVTGSLQEEFTRFYFYQL